jgi:hypothetical protein
VQTLTLDAKLVIGEHLLTGCHLAKAL